MSLIEWKDSLSVKIMDIDNQHRELIRILNELHEAMKTGKAKNVLNDILNRLIGYTKSHFKTEERLFILHKYPLAEQHIAEHDNFVNKVAEFKKKFDSGNVSLSIEVIKFLSSWVENHITGTDKKYTEFFNSKGIK